MVADWQGCKSLTKSLLTVLIKYSIFLRLLQQLNMLEELLLILTISLPSRITPLPMILMIVDGIVSQILPMRRLETMGLFGALLLHLKLRQLRVLLRAR